MSKFNDAGVEAKGKEYFGSDGFPITVIYPKLHHHQGGPRDLTLIPHYHDFTEIIIISGGSGVHEVEGHSYSVTSGDVFVIQGQQKHCFKHLQSLDIYNIMFDQSKIPLPQKQLRALPGYQALFLLEPLKRENIAFKSHLNLSLKDLEHTVHLIDGMMDERESELPGYEVILQNRLTELLVFLSRQYQAINTRDSSSLLLMGKVIHHIETHFNKMIYLKDLADLAHLSENRLIDSFKEATGKTPMEYLINIRLRKASELLKASSKKITDIAFEVGYEDSNYFSRHFKKMIGFSPREYRRRIENNLLD